MCKRLKHSCANESHLFASFPFKALSIGGNERLQTHFHVLSLNNKRNETTDSSSSVRKLGLRKQASIQLTSCFRDNFNGTTAMKVLLPHTRTDIHIQNALGFTLWVVLRHHSLLFRHQFIPVWFGQSNPGTAFIYKHHNTHKYIKYKPPHHSPEGNAHTRPCLRGRWILWTQRLAKGYETGNSPPQTTPKCQPSIRHLDINRFTAPLRVASRQTNA